MRFDWSSTLRGTHSRPRGETYDSSAARASRPTFRRSIVVSGYTRPITRNGVAAVGTHSEPGCPQPGLRLVVQAESLHHNRAGDSPALTCSVLDPFAAQLQPDAQVGHQPRVDG